MPRFDPGDYIVDHFFVLAVQGLHTLTAGWRAYVSPGVDLLPDLPPVEWLAVHDAQCIHQNITVEGLQVLHPYLLAGRAQKAIENLTARKILESVSANTYRYSAHTLDQIRNTERAILICAEKVTFLAYEQAERLAVLMTALIDMIAFGPNPAPTPIFKLVNAALAPSEHPLGQVHQRLVSLLAYRDDAHIAAWKAEGYDPQTIRIATFLFGKSEAVPISTLLQWPLTYEESYVRAALDKLLKEDEVELKDNAYKLTDKGTLRREKVENLTDQHFRAPFDQRISENGRRQWTTLMTVLAEGGRFGAHALPSGPSTAIVSPIQTTGESAGASMLKTNDKA
jgi:hypothetical protein